MQHLCTGFAQHPLPCFANSCWENGISGPADWWTGEALLCFSPAQQNEANGAIRAHWKWTSSPLSVVCLQFHFFGRSHFFCALNFKSYFHMVKFLQSHRTSVQIKVAPALLPLCHALAQGFNVWRNCARCNSMVFPVTVWTYLGNCVMVIIVSSRDCFWRYCRKLWIQFCVNFLHQPFCILDKCTACNVWFKYRLYSEHISSAGFFFYCLCMFESYTQI